ncbi:MarR family winged helix-turn-helix transcriptional regulator [Paenibacillus sp. NPDC057934]|uniref:MarR family winged helix-turn-helix transcriptional regulator n=1 Tax=Paenibacillus sp. NPDC057934 TaxID=3346282 RepID=UPI0036D86C1F
MTCTFERCTGISASRMQLLCHLYQSEEISQTSLQKLVGIDHAAITRHLKQLEAENMVIRRTSPQDNRFTLVKLTEYGRQEILTLKQEREQFLNLMLHGFSKQELTQLSTMLQRINQSIDQL